MARGRQQQGQQQPAPSQSGLPLDLRLYSPFPFKGINQKSSAIAANDDEFVWLENIVLTGPGRLSLGLSNTPTAVYTAPGGLTIISYPFFQLSGTKYLAIFLSDGSAVAFNLNSHATTTIGSAGFFSVATPPVVTTWASQATGLTPYLLIGTDTAYYIWDGTSLYGPGSLAPQVNITSGGFGYSSPPTVTITGGSGSGATGTAILSNGSVVAVQLTNPGSGYGPLDEGFLVVEFTGGGLTNAIAQATATIGGGGVTAVQITYGGTGYTNPSAVTFTGGGGTGAVGLPATVNAGSITSVLMVSPGTGYTATPTVTFPSPSSGTLATGVAVIGTNGITGITIVTGGSGYLSTPTVVVTDPYGSGTGFTGYAVINAGVVTGVNIVNPGQNYQGAVVSFVGGNPKVAAATVSLMPQGGANPISGVDIQVFKDRVWLINKTFRYTTAAGSVSDFAASAGGVISQNNDNELVYSLNGLAQSSGFLYEFGDSEVNAISNPVTTTTNNVPSTSYTVTNVDPQIGCPWRETIQPFGNAIIFASPLGVFGVYGGSLKKISDELDNLFASVAGIAQTQLPSASTVIMFGLKFYALTILLTDPQQQTNRQLILLWDGTRWYVATQDAAVDSLTPISLGGTYAAYGSDGTHIWPLFTTPSSTLQKKLISKYYGADSAEQYKQSLRFYLSAEQSFSYDVTMHSEQGDINLGSLAYPGAAGPGSPNAYGNVLTVLGQDAQGANGRFLGWTLTTLAQTNNIDYLALGYRYFSGYY